MKTTTRLTRCFAAIALVGRVAVLGLPGVTPVQGGPPIYVNGKIIGGVGASGVNSDQDEQLVQAGLNALK
ncbi:MAG: heme-binding protein [Burkholderiales bacterium]